MSDQNEIEANQIAKSIITEKSDQNWAILQNKATLTCDIMF